MRNSVLTVSKLQELNPAKLDIVYKDQTLSSYGHTVGIKSDLLGRPAFPPSIRDHPYPRTEHTGRSKEDNSGCRLRPAERQEMSVIRSSMTAVVI